MVEGSNDGGSGGGGGGLLDLERELTCSICTDILYQPLTLLDCLHTFCGSCLKEWFTWQAAAAVTSRRTTPPYTCPQCRESVRGTKADWRLTTLLEGYLKANPGRGKTEEEKGEMRQNYKPGEDVLPAVAIPRDEDDSEDERLLAHVRELSMANVDPESARRRAERSARERQRRRQERQRPGESGRSQQSGSWAAQRTERQRVAEDREVEHQPSLRSLLSDSQITSEDVQEEILQSIYSEGLLNNIDIDNLTPQQEEELTERIAEAYRRRQRHRERSRNRDRSRNGDREGPSSRSRQPSASAGRIDSSARGQGRAGSSPPNQAQQQQSRARPPISRPHLFEQTTAGVERSQRRSASSTGHQRQRSGSQSGSTGQTTQAARSATDQSQTPSTEDSQRPRPRALSSNNRSTTDPTNMRGDALRARNQSANLRPEPTGGPSSRPRSRDSDPTRRQTGPIANTSASTSPAPTTAINASPEHTPSHQTVRPAPSASAFAPEPMSTAVQAPPPQPGAAPSISCSRCSRPHIETALHYNCSKCASGNFNLCLQCYRAGQGCYHWFGFGFAALHRFERLSPPGAGATQEPPHILIPRRYTTPSTNQSAAPYPDTFLQEGAFCESCFAYTNDTYWYCEICLQGGWGYCDACVMQGAHCTHPLLPLAHISARRNWNPSHDPSKLAFLPLPHLKPHSYLLKPVETFCDICKSQILNSETRFHCYKCEAGDYDICNTCYHTLVSNGKISIVNGPSGWRRCLQSHRMAIVCYTNDGAARLTVRDPVGGWRLKDDSPSAVPPSSQLPSGLKYLSTWSRFPREEDVDELAFPKNAEIVEVEDLNEDWSVGVYAGRVGVFPRNHTRRI